MKLTAAIAQQQVLSSQMKQGLELLEAPIMELEHMIATEMLANPLLEGEAPLESNISEKNETTFLQDDPAWMESTNDQQAQEKHRYLLESHPSQKTLANVLEAQMVTWSQDDRFLAQSIVGNLDEWGYLKTTCSEVSLLLNASEQRIEEVLEKVQQLDPPGVAARDLKECLLIQLRTQGRENSLAAKIVAHYLPELARHQYEEIAKKLHSSLFEIRQAVHCITSLEPHPGRPYKQSEETVIIPDLIVVAEKGDFSVFLNEERLPRVRINQHYKEMLSSRAQDKELRDYLREKIRLGKSFIHHLEQRKLTLLALGNEIVRRQIDFFKYGTYGIHSLTMAQVAESLGMHLTTISRAVAGKTIDTPAGIFSLRYFFTTGIEQENGASVSSEKIKSSLKKIIQEEDKRHPLSDQKIVLRLKEEEIHVARRTIANYRDQLGILPANLRKK